MIFPRPYVCESMRGFFQELLMDEDFVIDKTGCKMVEIIGSSFIADEPAIFGTPNEAYLKKERDWYLSRSLRVADLGEPIPAAWKAVASKTGFINSNYGYLVFGHENYSQYEHVLDELTKNPYSRRACMIYMRPSMWYDYSIDGMNDFACTFAHTYHLRDGVLSVCVNMRSNDVVFGYKNDRDWAVYVLDRLVKDLNDRGVSAVAGPIIWKADSLHVYERHFHLVK